MRKISKEELAERKVRAKEWRQFRSTYLFTQAALANALGISARTVQYVEAGTYTPHFETIGAMRVLMSKHEREKK